MPRDVIERNKPDAIVGPTGERLTLASLPPPATKRWVIRRKAEVVAAVEGGLLSLEDARARYDLSEEEFGNWRKLIMAHGLAGLRTTKVQHYREA